MALISYAQNNEDVLLNRIFGGQNMGFYIDIGAAHPVDGSVTKLFYDRGWSGINLEPSSFFELLAAQRPRDINLRMAVFDRKGEVTFAEDSADRGLSRVVSDGAGVSVPCDTLEAIVARHGNGRPIDFIKIDAEGSEAAIVKSTDWRKLRPRVLILEATLPWSHVLVNDTWEPVLLEAGYVRAYFDGINCFYVPEEEWPHLSHHFAIPVNVLDNVVAYSSVVALEKAHEQLAQAEAKSRAAEASLAAARARQPVGASPSRGVMMRIARRVYRFVPPVARPLALRLRPFISNQTWAAMRAVRDRLGSIDDRIATTTAAEFRHLVSAVEEAMLTLAMRPLDRSAEANMSSDSAEPASSSIALRLPHDRRADIEVGAADLSLGAALRANNGDWEPHVRHYFESIVQPDWVCMDIGANLGAHTLSLACLASDGRVMAFEPDPVNYALLARNITHLPLPKALIEPLQIALGDRSGVATVGGADELAGCSFVSQGTMDAAMTEERLRAVVDPNAIADTVLHMRLAQVTAMRLDDWVKDRPLPRLDLIKMDVEGAEADVLRGADETLRRLRPILLVEYNPAAAAAYFGHEPDALYRELAARFATIHALEADGSLTLLPDWPSLHDRLAKGKGWEDLVCLPEPIKTP